jgi:hypothetical protein
MAPQDPGFIELTNLEARRRVCELIAIGLPESTIGELVGWSVGDVRRAIGEHQSVPP